MRLRVPSLLLVLVTALSVVVASGAESKPSAEPDAAELLLGETYPLEVTVSFPAALLHWLDSLARFSGPGSTAGKTQVAHREEYARVIGPLSPMESQLLRQYHNVRRTVGTRRKNRHALTNAFFSAATFDEALAQTRQLLGPADSRQIEACLRHFSPRYRKIWRRGEGPREFVERVRQDKQREAVAEFLVDVARFYEVPVDASPRPSLIVVPVPDGHGTHAQAIGRHMLIEVRPWEGLVDEVAPIVHENAHFLHRQMSPEKQERLEAVIAEYGQRGAAAWAVLHEALPTAIAQGVADQRFRRKKWSSKARWYHFDNVDHYAKAIFPLVKKSLARGEPFDEAFLREALELYGITRQSP